MRQAQMARVTTGMYVDPAYARRVLTLEENVFKIAGHIIKQNIRAIVHDVSQWKLDIRR
jgi:hypothetical protein